MLAQDGVAFDSRQSGSKLILLNDCTVQVSTVHQSFKGVLDTQHTLTVLSRGRER